MAASLCLLLFSRWRGVRVTFLTVCVLLTCLLVRVLGHVGSSERDCVCVELRAVVMMMGW